MKINVLEICNQLWIWGTEKTMQIFCKYLDRNIFNVYSCGMFRSGERFEFIKQNSDSSFLANWDVELVKKFVIEHDIHVVHWHSFTVNPWIEFDKTAELLQFFREKWIKIVETSPFSLYNGTLDNLTDLKLFVSRNSLIKFFFKYPFCQKNASKYNFLYNPLDIDDLSKFILDKNQKLELRQKYNMPKNSFVIWKIGRASLWKWDDTIIDIMPNLIKLIPEIMVVLRAIPEIKKKKIEKLWISKYFIFLPESKNEIEICETYQLMDVMVHTSRIGESFGITLAEWMFFWLPVITKSTDFTNYTVFDRDNSQIELIQNNINWYVVNKNNLLIERLYKLYNDKLLYSEISERNTMRAKNIFWAKELSMRLQKFLLWEWGIINNVSLQEYKATCPWESSCSLLKENIKAIYEKFILKA